MYTSVDVAGEAAFQLKHAVLVYGDDRRNFATVHDPIEGPKKGAPVLGPGRTLGAAFLKALAQGLGEALPLEVLPPEVLVRTPELTVWWRPRSVVSLFYNLTGKTRDVKRLAALSGRRVPQPALVFRATGASLAVRAIAGNARPTATTPLFNAPYYNVDRRGVVCLGSMPRPTSRGIDALAQWEAGFFGSEFTHPLPGVALTSQAGGFVALWADLARRQHRRRSAVPFPSRRLVAAKKQTLAAFIKDVNPGDDQ
jgi:PRTRC genetic system protein B